MLVASILLWVRGALPATICPEQDAPSPYADMHRAYVFMAAHAKTRHILQANLNAVAANESSSAHVCAAISHAGGGSKLGATALGMDVRSLSEDDARAIQTAYFPHATTQHALFQWDHQVASKQDAAVHDGDELDADVPDYKSGELSGSGHAARANKARRLMHQQLVRDGFSRIHAFPNLDVDALKAEARAALNRSAPDCDGVCMVPGPLEHLRPVLEDPRIRHAAAAYLGDGARLEGYAVLYLGARLTVRQYASGQWHHDRCGRRLKAFVYLDNVRERDHPTRIVRRSHRLSYFTDKKDMLTRFDDAWVNATYGSRIEPMYGPKGGGFIFDTNTVHIGDIEGEHTPREVVIVEYVDPAKARLSRACTSNPKNTVINELLKPVGADKVGSGAVDSPVLPRHHARHHAHALKGSCPSDDIPLESLECSQSAVLAIGKVSFRTWPCIQRRLSDLCPNEVAATCGRIVCIPIEPLRQTEWRLVSKGNADPDKFGGAQPVMLPSLFNVQSNRRNLYFDLGANTYDSSIGNWFLTQYPHASAFHIVAFEAETKYNATYKGRRVELVNAAVWTQDTVISWGRKFVVNSGAKLPAASTRPAVDIASFLRKRATLDDYVVVKLDIEGAEYQVVPHLLAQGVAPLIDEMFIEFHTEINSCCKPPNDKGRHRSDGLSLVQRMRDAGIYAHEYC